MKKQSKENSKRNCKNILQIVFGTVFGISIYCQSSLTLIKKLIL